MRPLADLWCDSSWYFVFAGGGGSFESTFYISNVVIAETTTDARSNILKELMEKFMAEDLSCSTQPREIAQASFQIFPISNSIKR